MTRFHKKVEMYKPKGNKGFSLIELIIAIAILVILTGFLAPNFMRYLERSRESVCRKNMDEMLNIYRIEHVGDDKYDVPAVIKAYKDREPCPSGGIYEDGTARMGGIPWIFCSIHDEEILALGPVIGATENVYKSMVDFAEKKYSVILEDLKKKYPTLSYFTNDTLRKYLFEQTYGNSWPKLDISDEIKQKYGISGDLYIQPCLNNTIINEENKNKDQIGSANDVIVFARGTNTADGGWHTSFIYDPNKKVWCKVKKGISVNDKTWDEVKAEMDKVGYTEITEVK